jgi:hypothetical protein
MVLAYVQNGIGFPKRIRYSRAAFLSAFLIAVSLISTGGTGLAAATGLYIVLIAVLAVMVIRKRMNGDNRLQSAPSIDSRYFDYVQPVLGTIPVSFPLDVGNYKYDRGKGYIKNIGMVMSGKHGDKYGAVIESGGKRFLCPLDQVKLLENITGILAKKGEHIAVTCGYWDGDRREGGIVILRFYDIDKESGATNRAAGY